MDIKHIYDLDGVIATHNSVHWDRLKSPTLYFLTRRLRYRPLQESFSILTARLTSDAIATALWLTSRRLRPKSITYMNPKRYNVNRQEDQVSYKLEEMEKILYPNITTVYYYEDNPLILRGMQERFKLEIGNGFLTLFNQNMEKISYENA